MSAKPLPPKLQTAASIAFAALRRSCTPEETPEDWRKRHIRDVVNENYARVYRGERIAKRRTHAEKLAARRKP